jgi:hypothetical protein
MANDRCREKMKLTGEAEGLALVLDTAPLKARRWSRLKVSPAWCAAGGLLGAIVWPFRGYQYPTRELQPAPPPPPPPEPESTHGPASAAAPGSEGASHVSSSQVSRRVPPLAHVEQTTPQAT